jgi:hypothetical protein
MVKVIGSESELSHWMWSRVIRRTGIDKTKFVSCSIEDGESWDDASGLILLGESGLNHVLSQAGIERWWGHIVSYNDIPCLCLPAPSRLLPFKSEAVDDEDNDKPFRQPTRYLGAVNQAIHWLFASVQGTREWRARDYSHRNYSWDNYADFRTFTESALRLRLPLSFDIETAYDSRITNEEDKEEYIDKDTILRISFSIEEYQGISVPFGAEYLDDIVRLLESDLDKVCWNGRGFDIPMLRKQNGIEVRGRIYDAMDIWHVIQSDLERGLEHASAWLTVEYPWKHFNQENPQLYSCIDSDVALRCFLSSRDRLQKMGLWKSVEYHFVESAKYLDVASRNGVPLNLEEQKKLSIEFRDLAKIKILSMQNLVPDSLKRKKLYTRQQLEDWIPVDGLGTERYCSKCGQVNVNVKHPCFKEDSNLFGPKAELVTREIAKTFFYKPAPKEDASYDEVRKWLEANGFNPNSADQVKSYCKMMHHPLGTNWKTDEDSADTKHLEKLAKIYGEAHPVYEQTVDFRKLNKALTAFVDGWVADDIGNISTFYSNAPSTFRLSSRNVNLQQVSARAANPYAIRSRSLIYAPDGFVFVGADSTAIEAVMSGWYMGDPAYILAAKQDIHSYVTARHLGMKWEGAKTIKIIKTKHNETRDQFKRVNHALNYGATPYMIHMTSPDVFKTVKEAKSAVDSIMKSLPLLGKWHENLRTTAHETGKLTNAWGYTFYFHDVHSYKLDEFGRVQLDEWHQPIIKKGKDYNRLIAVLPQSSAAIFMRENIVEIGKRVPDSWIPANYSIHDAIYLLVPDTSHDVDYASSVIKDVLTRPIPEMGGLTIGCELSVGKDWFNMSKIESVDML